MCTSPCGCGRVLAHATTNTNTTRKQRYRAASPVAARSPMQACITPHGAHRDAYSPPDASLSHILHHQPPPSPCRQRRRLRLFCQRLRKGRQRSVERRRRSASLNLRTERALVPALAARWGVALWAACSAPPTAAAPPHRAPAVAVERLGNARRHASFARPATVRARVGGRIGPLAHGVRRRGQVAEHESGP